MGYNKYIKSGNRFELYEYEHESFAKGRPRGYKFNFNREDMEDSGSVAFQQRKHARRKDNARNASMAFKRLVLSNLTREEVPLLLTLTFAENRKSVSECSRFFHVFTIRMRKTFGKDFRYIAVPEFQQRGAVHYHALFWGLPQGIEERERRSRQIAKIWAEGFIDIVKTDGNEKLSSYLAKYMVKAINDIRLLFHKAYFCSRNVLRPVKSSGFPIWWVEQEFNLPSANLISVSEYDTKWLGRGKYKNYYLSS